MLKSKVVLPKVYENDHVASSGRFPQHDGRPKISYSQYNSWCEDAYRGSYIGKYFLGVDDPGNMFTDFGGFCGEYLETGVDESSYLDAIDIQWLNTVEKPKHAEYEREIVLDRGMYVAQGFIDQNFEEPTKQKIVLMNVIDFKTGGEKKKADYAGDGYQQTTLYARALVEEGIDVGYSGVQLLPRKGNKLDKSSAHPMRIVGEPIDIPTPYSEERADKFLEKLDATTKDISDHYKCYLKFFGLLLNKTKKDD